MWWCLHRTEHVQHVVNQLAAYRPTALPGILLLQLMIRNCWRAARLNESTL